MAGLQLVLEDLDLRLDRAAPEFAIQVPSSPGATRVIFKTRGIANGINLQMKIFSQFRFAAQFGNKSRCAERPGRFISMNGSEKPDTQRIGAVRPDEGDARNEITFSTAAKRAKLPELDAGQSEQRLEKLLNR